MHEIVNIANLMVLRNCKIKGNRTISIQIQVRNSICGFSSSKYPENSNLLR